MRGVAADMGERASDEVERERERSESLRVSWSPRVLRGCLLELPAITPSVPARLGFSCQSIPHHSEMGGSAATRSTKVGSSSQPAVLTFTVGPFRATYHQHAHRGTPSLERTNKKNFAFHSIRSAPSPPHPYTLSERIGTSRKECAPPNLEMQRRRL